MKNMCKKVLIIFILIAFINFITGCYTFNSVTVPEYKQVEMEEVKPNEIYVKTKSNEWYHFTNSQFYIKHDTLYGISSFLSDDWQKASNTKIALSDIESMGVESKNWYLTSLVYFVIIGGIIVTAIAIGWLFSPKEINP
ncbi:hypothetical protein ACFLQ4_02165 [Bacteroidota bacterium]